MRARPSMVLVAALLRTVCLGQEPTPAFTYTLHAQKDTTNRGSVALTPDDALIVLLSREDNQWLLKRITGWDTVAPHEETLALDGRVPNQYGQADHNDLTVDPAGNLLAVRFCFNRINWVDLSGSDGGPGPEAVVTLIDLRAFTVISRRVATDPLIAAGTWRFNKNGLLIADGLVKPSRIASNGVPINAGTYGDGVFSVPDLKSVASCSYTRLYILPQETRPDFQERVKRANADCAAVLEAGSTSSIDELSSKLFDYQGYRIAKFVNPDAIVRVNPKDPRWSPEDHCTFIDVGQGDRFADYRCEFLYLTISSATDRHVRGKVFYRATEVFSVADGKRVLVVHLPFKESIDSRIAASRGHDYLLLLRDAIKLEVYRLPQK
ncbi:MAG: hypothetical protein ABSH32_22310 [Bryobacteraceae bacterium]